MSMGRDHLRPGELRASATEQRVVLLACGAHSATARRMELAALGDADPEVGRRAAARRKALQEYEVKTGTAPAFARTRWWVACRWVDLRHHRMLVGLAGVAALTGGLLWRAGDPPVPEPAPDASGIGSTVLARPDSRPPGRLPASSDVRDYLASPEGQALLRGLVSDAIRTDPAGDSGPDDSAAEPSVPADRRTKPHRPAADVDPPARAATGGNRVTQVGGNR